MSWIAYINGQRLELSSASPVAQTKQVNDLARLDNRQTNFTNRFIAPLTATNVKAMDKVYLVGSQSNLPYQKNVFDLFDSDTGECLIYKGWANVSKTTDKGYEIYIYDGYIDFYKSIENTSLTDIGIAGLNHAKSLTNIIDSWNNTLPYMYCIADYNGKNTYVSGGTTVNINVDYQVPSARIEYIWNQIFAYAGFTYSGSFFNTEKFKNWFMSFPKPVPTLVPLVENITTQTSTITDRWVQQPDFSYIIFFDVHFFPTPITTPRLTINSIGSITINQSGAFRIKCSGVFNCSYNGGPSTQSGMITIFGGGQSATINAQNDEEVILSFNAGDTVFLMAPFYASSGSVTTTIDAVLGYDANFENALVDFKTTDFVNQVMQFGGLTAFKSKYENHIEFKTIDELIVSTNILDWSDKYLGKTSEVYKIGNYSQKNNFKYRYNGENEKHNDGSILIADENLNDEGIIFQSKIYSPERDLAYLANKMVNVFKIWNKNLKDDGTIEYKDLSGRFYFMRYQNEVTSVVIGSEKLNQSQTVNNVKFASFSRLKFNEIIIDNYLAISNILDKSKMLEASFDLNMVDISKFDFKSLIYVEQLSSYYMVNKIKNFVKNKPTTCEIIKVDYAKASTIVIPPVDTATFITVDSLTVVGCVVTLTFTTDASLGSTVNLVCGVNTFGVPVFTPIDPIYGFGGSYTVTAPTMTISFTLQAGAFYDLYLQVQNVTPQVFSTHQYFDNNAGCLITSPTTLVITNVTLLSQDALTQTFKIDFTSDAVLPRNVYVQNYKTPVPSGTFGLTWGGWSGYTDNGTATIFSINHSVSRIFGDPLQLQIRIGTKESNVYNI